VRRKSVSVGNLSLPFPRPAIPSGGLIWEPLFPQLQTGDEIIHKELHPTHQTQSSGNTASSAPYACPHTRPPPLPLGQPHRIQPIKASRWPCCPLSPRYCSDVFYMSNAKRDRTDLPVSFCAGLGSWSVIMTLLGNR
jgi:hypothetical protein